MTTAVKKRKAPRRGVYVTKTPVVTPFAGDEGFQKLLETARYNAAQVKRLAKKGRAEQGRMKRHQEDTVIAVREFANERNLPVKDVAEQIARLLIS